MLNVVELCRFRPITADEYYQGVLQVESEGGRSHGCIKLWKKLYNSRLQILVPESKSSTVSSMDFSTMTNSNLDGGMISESEFSTETAVNIYEDLMWRMSQNSK